MQFLGDRDERLEPPDLHADLRRIRSIDSLIAVGLCLDPQTITIAGVAPARPPCLNPADVNRIEHSLSTSSESEPILMQDSTFPSTTLSLSPMTILDAAPPDQVSAAAAAGF